MNAVGEGRTPPPDAVARYRMESRGDAMIFHCAGAFVLPNFQRLDELIRDVKAIASGRIVLNLTHVDRIDSVGIGTLSMILKHVMVTGVDLRVVPNEYVKMMLGTSGLDRVFQFERDVDAALQDRAPRS